MLINSEECKAAGIDEKEVARIARGLAKYAKEADKLNIMIFGGSDLSMRFNDHIDDGFLILANIEEGSFSGGCGACIEDENGLLRGEN